MSDLPNNVRPAGLVTAGLRRLLKDQEYNALSPEDRAMFDDAIQQVPSERNPEIVILMLASRGIIKYDTAGIHTAVAGVFELQDKADEATRELLDTARAFRADTAIVRGELEALSGRLSEFVSASTADRADLRRRANRADRRIYWLWVAVVVLALIVAVLFADLVYRLWPVLIGMGVSLLVLLGVR
jgi:hypothetical protein